MPNTIRLLAACPDARGIVAAVAEFVSKHGGNLIDADQHTDKDHGEFFIRLSLEREGFQLNRETFAAAWEPVAKQFKMTWRIYWGEPRKRMLILCSKQLHCLVDLLSRWRMDELDVEVPMVFSNHVVAKDIARDFGVRFEYCPVTPETRDRQEARLLELAEEVQPDFLVLARYMQILSPRVIAAYPNRIINIHHSFLPAFAGGSPYQQAYDRGVKMIGATSHYVTQDLDAGPIIAQDTAATTHRDTVSDLVRKGRDLERVVLARAVHLHVADKILVSQNKTVVF